LWAKRFLVGELRVDEHVVNALATTSKPVEVDMGFGRGALLWLLGVPLPIIILLALFWHH
jgi:hypothetical protein